MLDSRTLTLSGAVQQLAQMIATAEGTSLDEVGQRPVRELQFQPDGGNSDPIYLGTRAAMSTSDYAFRLEGATGGIPPAPFMFELSHGGIKLRDLWILGTLDEVIHVLWAVY